jgi:hypothetical protein
MPQKYLVQRFSRTNAPKIPAQFFATIVMKAFTDHHQNLRAPELLAAASALIKESGVDGTAAVSVAARVLDLAFRRYRASLAVEKDHDSKAGRAALFKGCGKLGGIGAKQRLGATFIVDGDLRDWFDGLAGRAIAAIDDMAQDNINV